MPFHELCRRVEDVDPEVRVVDRHCAALKQGGEMIAIAIAARNTTAMQQTRTKIACNDCRSTSKSTHPNLRQRANSADGDLVWSREIDN